MFCYQCEQTAGGKGCTVYGVCGKSPEVAALQDLLIYAVRGLSLYAVEGRKIGINDAETNRFTSKAIFATLTNVNFDPERLRMLVWEAVQHREALRKMIDAGGASAHFLEGPAAFKPEKTIEGLVTQGQEVGIRADLGQDPDVHSLIWTLIYGIKGISAYTDHASILGREDDTIYQFIQEGLVATLNKNATLEEMVGLVMRAGSVNLRAMELLYEANTGAYGDPVPTKVPPGAKKGKAILVSGHDLKDLELILKQSQGRGINVCTRGDASSSRLPWFEEVSAFLRPLRHGVAKSEKRIRGISRGHRDDDELHPAAAGLV